MAEPRCQSIQYHFWLSGRFHCRSKLADCEDLEEFGGVVFVGLVFRGFEGVEDVRGRLFSEDGLEVSFSK